MWYKIELLGSDIKNKSNSVDLYYSLRPILLFANTDVSITKMCLDTSILAKSIMDRREYVIYINWPKINPEKVVDCLNFKMEEVTVNTESDREILTNMRAKMP
jgi:hypothetical protein